MGGRPRTQQEAYNTAGSAKVIKAAIDAALKKGARPGCPAITGERRHDHRGAPTEIWSEIACWPPARLRWRRSR